MTTSAAPSPTSADVSAPREAGGIPRHLSVGDTAERVREAADAADLARRRYVLFDFDGTLADTKPGIIATAVKVLREWGMTDEQIGDAGRLVGPPFPRAYCDIYGVTPQEADELARRYSEAYFKLGPESHALFAGMDGLLRELRDQGRTLAVATSKHQEAAERFLQEDGVLDLFAVVAGKVDPAHADKATAVRRALAAMGARPEDAVMVGDRFYDVEGARANGVPCVGVLFGTATRQEMEEAGAAAIVESVDGLRAVLLGPRRATACGDAREAAVSDVPGESGGPAVAGVSDGPGAPAACGGLAALGTCENGGAR